MQKTDTIICEYEELIKIKEFHRAREWDAYRWTYQRVIKDIESEYTSSTAEKLDRWVSITNARYFKYAPAVLFYFLAKMLYRDGYYEAGIAVARSICEMICYDFLSKEPHPFGTEDDIEQIPFGMLSKFLAVPKKMPSEEFRDTIVAKIGDIRERDFIKSCYRLDQSGYIFKVENEKERKNLKRIHAVLDEAGYEKKSIFPKDTFKIIQSVYDKGSDYVHARKTEHPKDDAVNSINGIGIVLAHLYNVEGNEMQGQTMVTGYNAFPDVSQGGSFWMDAYLTDEDANLGYYNVPSIAQFEKMVALAGEWQGEWRTQTDNNEMGTLHFLSDGDYVKASLKIGSDGKVYYKIDTILFGDYFHLYVHETNVDGSRGNIIIRFEFDIFNNVMLMGKVLGEEKKAYFKRANTIQ